MRRTGPLLLLSVGLLAPSCSGRSPAPATPSAASSVRPSVASPLAGASCDEHQGGSSENTPDFVAVRTEHDAGIDRVVFRFRPRAPVSAPPSFNVRFTDRFTSPEGNPVPVAGSAFVAVTFGALGVDLSTETPRPIYTGPQDIRPGFPNLLHLKELEDFEATITWGLGLLRRACFRVRAAPNQLVVEFPSP